MADRKGFFSDMPKQLLKPKYWPVWLGVLFIKLATMLPYKAQLLIGRGIGLFLYRLARGRRHIVEVNIGLCFPEKSASEQAALVRQTFIDNGIGVMETMIAWFRPRDFLLSRTHFHGLEKIKEAQAAGRGVLLLGGHYSMLDLSGALITNHIDAYISYRPQDNPAMDYVVQRGREQLYEDCFTRKDIRGFIRALKKQGVLWYAQDQDFGRKNSIFVDFFGIPTATITATSRIAKAGNAVVLPMTYFRREDNSGYDITVHDALPIPSGDDVEDARMANAFLEQQIRQHPSQYLWLHKRFKSRPPEEGVKKGDFYKR
ncbi:LpxL/LpxP family Kdo(2)-lipid IV(A) lauroyl/palmitoleoyl acyltransferase [Thalassolituus sp. UBA6592]|uniref:LpxL/LpxP family Kdo(2)-lipid IV(A) lauroyl/palmitoleoyl acyltransferase n=1 Tax=Thalassolituus sp. UBA6592 TaxID=1947665 RepID=UPI0025FC414F|nr:LpxL/LpxP family Kdo(2)-lipid IV(A) lauroyl/palmitoleoyl acyltransferase [Thalassolituus sp. UBA6592]|tara:strand:+ start:2541 stop:3485 length:945 start_codon:yes stop_codon:yes gene_type:complete